MVNYNFTENEIKELKNGIEYTGIVRGFNTASDGVMVKVKKNETGLRIKDEGGKYLIEYKSKSDFYRAISILTGCIEQKKVNFNISEKSSLNMCGIMVDCSRGAVMKVEKIFDLLARIALMGMNTFMLYTEDTYALENYEYFGYMRGAYTKEELQLIEERAGELGIELIPCIQTLAHLKTTLRWEYADDMKDDPDVLLIGEEKTYELIEEMFKHWRSVCKTNKIHIGMDEAEGVGLGEYLNKHGYCDRFEIMSRHINRVCEIAKKYDFEPMMWSDMFFKIGSKKRFYYDLDTIIPDDISTKIPDDLSMVYWDYYHDDENLYLTMLKNHKKLGRDVIFAGGAWTWRGLGPQYKKTFDTTIPALKACRKEKINNIIATIWKDDGAEVSTYSMLLGISLFAEYNYYDKVDYDLLKKNFELCTGYNADDFIKLSIDDIPAKKRDSLATSKQIVYQDILCGLFDKNFAEYDLKGYYKKLMDELEKINYPKELGYLFEYYKVLSELLYEKCDIGTNIRNAYKSKGKEKLRECNHQLLNVYRCLENYHKVLYTLWETENKPFGFELLERRIGGIMKRVESTQSRILEYYEGKTENISELEEELLWYGGNDTKGHLLETQLYKDLYINLY